MNTLVISDVFEPYYAGRKSDFSRAAEIRRQGVERRKDAPNAQPEQREKRKRRKEPPTREQG